MFTEHGLLATKVDDFAAFNASSAPLRIAASPLAVGSVLVEEKICLVTETELYPSSARQTRRKRAKTTNVDSVLGTCPRSASAIPWCTRSTASAAISAWCRSTSVTAD